LEKNNHINDLEIARHNLIGKTHMQKNIVVEEQSVESNQVLFLGFGEEDVDDYGFTSALSKKNQEENEVCLQDSEILGEK
jgi:hypothetical protein